MKHIRKKEQGFSLLELLATILIVSLVLGISGYFIMNTINTSKEKSNVIAINNIKNIADVYSKEYPEDIIWSNNEACVSIKELINKGYLKEEEIEKNTNAEYIILTRDDNHTIISSKLDSKGICSKSNSNKVPLPTSKEYCSNLVYDPESSIDKPAILTKPLDENAKVEFSNNTGVDAGNYTVTVKLKNTVVPEENSSEQDGNKTEYIWEDGSTEDKTITCTIKKAIPELKPLEGNPTGEDGKNLEDTELILLSNIQGNFKVKSSNKEFATASIGETTTEKNNKGYYETTITIKKLAKREANTYITITLSPSNEEDKKNYYSGTFVYTIGEVKTDSAAVLTCNDPLYYNGEEQELVTQKENKYFLYNNKSTENGTYEVIAQLKYGYIWEDGSYENLKLNCEIKLAKYTITYDTNGGSTCNPETKEVFYNSPYGELCEPTFNGYTFKGWKTSDDKQINSNSIVTTKGDHKLTAQWEAKTFTATMDANGGTNGNYNATWTATYGQTYNVTKYIPTRAGYIFAGWYSAKTGGTLFSGDFTWTASNFTFYAHWTNVPTYSITLDPNGGVNGNYTASWTLTSGETYNLNGKTPTRTGYNFAGWFTARTGGTKVSGTQTCTTSKTYYAQWTAKTVTVTFIRNYNSSDNTPTTQIFTYGKSGQSFNSGFTKTGYTALGWSTNRNANSATYSFRSGIEDSWINSNSPSITLYAIWRVNVCTINYKPNGGKFNSNASNTTQKMNYGTSTSNMRNATGSGGYYNATRSDAYNKVVSDAEWKTADNRTFNQANGYSATQFCPNLANGDQTVNLYVNWYDTKYRKSTCKTCKRCSSAACQTYKSCTYSYACGTTCSWNACPSSHQYYGVYKRSCCNAGGNCIPNPNGQSCKTKYCSAYGANSACGCKTRKRSCPNCGCSDWNAWSDYTLNSCTKNSSTKCESKKVYPALKG